MSIFNESFDLGVNNQLKTREQILSSNFSGQWRGILENRPEAYLQYANNKTPFIRLSSGVNVVNPILQKYFGISQPDELATRFILEGGTLASTQKKSGDGILSSQRSNFVGKNSVYGASDLGGTSDFGLRPMPGISGISIKSYGENIATLRIATITLDCYTLQQLEALELLYMRPGYRVLLEWGHTQFWLDADDKISSQTNQAIDIIKLDKTKQDILSKIDDYRNITSYNYDAMLGEIKNYSWDAQTNGSYRCTIEIISVGAVIDSLRVNIPPLYKTDDNSSNNNPVNASSIFVNVLDSIKTKVTNTQRIHTIKISSDGAKWPENLKNRDFDVFNLGGGEDSKYKFIALKNLLLILNESGIYLEGDTTVVTINYDLGKCKSHPYQISGNPKICLINPDTTSNQIQYNFSDYGNRFKNQIDTCFPYREGDPYSGNIGEIMVNIDYCIDLFNSLLGTKENKSIVILKDYIQSLMDDISNSIGDINQFQVVLSPDNPTIVDIIDYKFINANINKLTGKDAYYTIPLMGIGTGLSNNMDENELGGTYVRSYRLNTKLTNEIATTVSIGAQAGDKIGVNGVDSSVFNAFNQGIIDRLVEPIGDTGDNKNNNKQKEKKVDIQQLGDNIVNELNRIGVPYTNPLEDEDISSLTSNIKSLISYSVTATKSNAIVFGSYTPLPLDLEITMDGISGIKVGTIFLIPPDRLPFQYKIFDPVLYGIKNIGLPRVGFVIFGVDHNVSGNTGWETTLNCKMVMLNPNIKPTLFDNDFQITEITEKDEQDNTSNQTTNPNNIPPNVVDSETGQFIVDLPDTNLTLELDEEGNIIDPNAPIPTPNNIQF